MRVLAGGWAFRSITKKTQKTTSLTCQTEKKGWRSVNRVDSELPKKLVIKFQSNRFNTENTC